MSFLGMSIAQFANENWLYALMLPVLIIIWVWANRWLITTRRVVLPVDRSRRGGGWIWWSLLTLVECLPALILAVGIILMAGPQKYGPPQQKRSMTNIEFAVDVSGSMTSPFGEGTRYDASMAAIDKFLDHRKGDSFGLTFFGVAFVHWVPLTSDASAIRCAPPFMRPEVAPPPFGGTAIATALRGCKKQLADRDDGDKMIVLISDGYSGDLFGADQEIAKEMNDAGITVFAIIVGAQPQDEVVNICRLTGGEAFSADDPEALPAVFHKIDTMKQAKFTPTFVETVDDFQPYTTTGLILIALGTLALYGLRFTPW